MVAFEIDEKLANDILEYLSNRPYKEVVVMIDGMRGLKKVEAKP